MKTEASLKIVTLGKEATGKTALVERFLNDVFLGHDRKLDIDGHILNLGLWDTAGSERYESITHMYCRDAKAAVVCYAVDDRGSWERLKHWVEELKFHEEGCRVYLCATKKDLLTGGNIKRAVHYTTTTDYCEEIGAKLFETSSKNGSNVSKLFEEIARDYLTMNRHEEPAADGEKLTLVEIDDNDMEDDPVDCSCSCIKKSFWVACWNTHCHFKDD